MRKSRFRDEQIIGILKEHQVGLREELSKLEPRRVALTAQLANADSDDMPVLQIASAAGDRISGVRTAAYVGGWRYCTSRTQARGRVLG